MSITPAVLALQHNLEFRGNFMLNFVQTADWILGGNFPASVATAADKNTVTAYMSDVYQGKADLNAQVRAMLAQTAIQDKINSAEGVAGAYSIMQSQVRANLKYIAGCKPVY